MAVDIGPKIGIDGEAEFRKQINLITQQVKTFGSEMQAVTSQFGKNQGSMEALTAKNEVLQKSIEAQTRKVAELKKGLEAAAAQFGENDSKTLRWQQAVNDATADLNRMQGQMKENESSMERFGKELDATGEAFDDAGQKAIGFGDIVGASLVADAISAIKDVVIDIGKELAKFSMESENAGKKATAYFGETGEAARQTEQVIKDVYGSGVGDSMDRVSDAVITVKKNLDSLSQADMTALTQQAITLEDLYGVDMNETLRGVNSLMEQFGMDAQTAMDYVVAGTQNGLDKTNELGDNLAEYSGKFAQAGYSAEQYFQLLENGLDGGAYNLDKVNDAINEVTTRLADGTVEDAIESYSKETQDLFKSWKEGGATQKDVIDSIVKDIKGTKNQQDALNKAATAFGTMAEDGNLKFITSLTSVGSTYSDVTGKAGEMFDATTTSQQELEAAMRTAKEHMAPIGDAIVRIATEIIPKLAEAFMGFTQFLSENAPVIVGLIAGIGTAFLAMNVGSIIAGVSTAFQTMQTAILGVNAAMLANPIGIVVAALVGLGAALVVAYNTSEEFRDAVNAAFEMVKETIVAAIETAKEAITAAWEFISTDTGGKMGVIQAAVNSAFQAIKTVINVVMTAIQGVMKAATQIMSGDWSGAWNTIKETTSNIVGQIKDHIKTSFDNILTGIKTTVKNISDAVKNGLEVAVNYVKELPGKFLTWGKDMIDNLVNGIRAGIGAVGDAVEAVADKISAFLHFTEPDEGPLSNFHTFMPDMTKLLVTGIRAGIPDVRDAINDMAANMVPKVPEYANGNAAAYDRLAAQMGGMQIVLQDGTVVGRMAPKFNKALGGIRSTEGRYGI